MAYRDFMHRPGPLSLALLLLGMSMTASAWLQPATGNPPPLELQDLDGRSHALDAYRGRVVLINFWGMWCPPCLREMPSLQRLRQAMEGRPFTILAVNVNDSLAKVSRYVDRFGLTFTVLRDSNKTAVYREWQVKVFPTTYLLDVDGNIAYRATGALEWDDDEPLGIIESLLPMPVTQAAASQTGGGCRDRVAVAVVSGGRGRGARIPVRRGQRCAPAGRAGHPGPG